MSDQPWYTDGLRFECTQCGNCCTGDPGVVWVDEDELQAIADFLQVSLGEVRLEHTRLYGRRVSLREFANGDCTFFDGATRRCRIYPVRPRQCRTWPFWRSNLESPQTWTETGQGCPGINCGELVQLDEIERRAAVIEI